MIGSRRAAAERVTTTSASGRAGTTKARKPAERKEKPQIQKNAAGESVYHYKRNDGRKSRRTRDRAAERLPLQRRRAEQTAPSRPRRADADRAADREQIAAGADRDRAALLYHYTPRAGKPRNISAEQITPQTANASKPRRTETQTEPAAAPPLFTAKSPPQAIPSRAERRKTPD